MKKILSLILIFSVLTSAVAQAAPSKLLATDQEMSHEEAYEKLENAKMALTALEAELDRALHGQRAEAGRVAMTVRNGAAIVTAIGIGWTAMYLIKASTKTGLGGRLVGGIFGAIIGLVTAATSQGVIYLTDQDIQETREKIEKCRATIAEIEAKL